MGVQSPLVVSTFQIKNVGANMFHPICIFFLKLKYGQRSEAIYTLRHFINTELPHLLGLYTLKSITKIGTADYYVAQTALSEVRRPLLQALSHLTMFQSPVPEFILELGLSAEGKALQFNRTLGAKVKEAISSVVSCL